MPDPADDFPTCATCGYVLSAEQGQCPECGAEFVSNALWVAQYRARVGQRWSGVPAGVAITILALDAAMLVAGFVWQHVLGQPPIQVDPDHGIAKAIVCGLFLAPLAASVAWFMHTSRRNRIVLGLSFVPLLLVVLRLVLR